MQAEQDQAFAQYRRDRDQQTIEASDAAAKAFQSLDKETFIKNMTMIEKNGIEINAAQVEGYMMQSLRNSFMRNGIATSSFDFGAALKKWPDGVENAYLRDFQKAAGAL